MRCSAGAGRRSTARGRGRSGCTSLLWCRLSSLHGLCLWPLLLNLVAQAFLPVVGQTFLSVHLSPCRQSTDKNVCGTTDKNVGATRTSTTLFVQAGKPAPQFRHRLLDPSSAGAPANVRVGEQVATMMASVSR